MSKKTELARLENSPDRVKTGYSRTGKADIGSSGASGRYRTAIEPVPIDREVFQNPDTRTVHWDIVEQMFIEGWPTTKEDVRYWPNLKELSEMTGISYQRIQNRSSKYRWYQLQQTWKGSFIAERKKRRIETLVNLSFDFDDLQLEVASRGAAMVLRRQEQIERIDDAKRSKFDEAIKKLEDGTAEFEDVKTDLYGGIYHSEMEALAKAAAAFQEIGMKALGTDKERIELTGADGGLITMHNISSGAELSTDNPERAAVFMQTMLQIKEINEKSQTNLEQLDRPQIEQGTGHYDDDDVIDVEVEEVAT